MYSCLLCKIYQETTHIYDICSRTNYSAELNYGANAVEFLLVRVIIYMFIIFPEKYNKTIHNTTQLSSPLRWVHVVPGHAIV